MNGHDMPLADVLELVDLIDAGCHACSLGYRATDFCPGCRVNELAAAAVAHYRCDRCGKYGQPHPTTKLCKSCGCASCGESGCEGACARRSFRSPT